MKLLKGLIKNPMVTGSLLGGTGNAAVWDVGNLSDNKGWRSIPGIGTVADLVEGKMSPVRRNNLILNSIIGAASGSAGMSGLKHLSKGNAVMGTPLVGLGLTGFLATPYKDAAQTATNFLDKNRQIGKDIVDTMDKQIESSKGRSNITNWLLGGALGLGGAGLLYSLLKKDKPEKAKMQVKLPGDPNDPDSDVTIEVPVTAGKLRPDVLQGIRKSLRKQTAKNVRSQQRKRDLQTGKLIPYDEWQAKYGEPEYGAKEASMHIMQKEAEGREWAEGLGSALAPAISGLAAAYATNKATGDSTKSMLAGAGAALLPMLAGSLLGRAANKHTAEQQAEHDASPALLEYLIPGYAQYQSARRARTGLASTTPSGDDVEAEDDELDTDDDIDYEDELDKYAAAQAPMPPSGGAPMAPPPSSPIPPAPAPGMVGSRPDRLSGSSNVTAGTDRRPSTSNSANKLRKAADNLKSWLAQYGTRMG